MVIVSLWGNTNLLKGHPCCYGNGIAALSFEVSITHVHTGVTYDILIYGYVSMGKAAVPPLCIIQVTQSNSL